MHHELPSVQDSQLRSHGCKLWLYGRGRAADSSGNWPYTLHATPAHRLAPWLLILTPEGRGYALIGLLIGRHWLGRLGVLCNWRRMVHLSRSAD